MVNRKNRCTSILNASGTSSCSDYIDHCCQRKCNNTCCRDQCEYINDRTYTTLRKICHKIFKDYNRSQCREKYTIFDGGNSINVRIHRSGSRGDENRKDHRYEKASSEHRYQLQNKHNNYIGQDGRGGKLTGDENSTDQKYEKVSSEDRYRLQNKHSNIISQDGRVGKISGRKPGRDGEKFDSDVDVYNRDQTKRGKGKNAGVDVNDDNVYDKRNKKLESTKRGEGKDNVYNEQNYNEKKLKGKQKFGQGIDTNSNRNGERDINGKAIENRRSKSRKDSVENTYTKKGESWNDSKRGSRDNNESEVNYNGKGKLSSRGGKKDEKKSKPLKKGETSYKDDDMIIIGEMTKTKNRKAKNKYSVDKDDAVISSDDEVTNKKKYIKGKKSKIYGDDIDNFVITANSGSERNSSKSKNNRYRKSQGFDDVGKSKDRNYHVINNLRKKVRRGDNVGFNNGSTFSDTRKLQKLMLPKPESLQYRQTKRSRADEVRACDYLRALMEQRELCQCQFSEQSSQFNPIICIPQTCMSSCGPKTVIPCFSETCEC
ncbi:uncharacterized protein LOC135949519 [Calliphora vicina]|uniref:uncharacterized protein LOC135949519 n=1 Tax=Calliphora vicina TaxID=7373 RepID=UPI00325B2052